MFIRKTSTPLRQVACAVGWITFATSDLGFTRLAATPKSNQRHEEPSLGAGTPPLPTRIGAVFNTERAYEL